MAEDQSITPEEQIKWELDRFKRWVERAANMNEADPFWELAYRSARLSELQGKAYEVIWSIFDIANILGIHLEETPVVIADSACDPYPIRWTLIRREDGTMARSYVPARPREIVEHYQDIFLSPPDWSRSDEPGFVYVLSSTNGLAKIGESGDVRSRFKQLCTEARPYKLTFEFAIYSNGRRQTEADLLYKYWFANVSGEWFNFSLDEFDELRPLATHFSIDECAGFRALPSPAS